MTEFIWSVKNGELMDVRNFVEQEKKDINAQIEGRCPIHYAADYGQTEVIKYLISKGANINVLDKHGISALLAATWEGHKDCVKYLLSQGADKNLKAPDGRPISECAETDEIKQLLQ